MQVERVRGSLTHHNTVVRTITHFTLLGNIYLYTLVEISRDGASSKSNKVPVCRHVCTLRPCDDDAMGGWMDDARLFVSLDSAVWPALFGT
jgi:hypothetical protein